jgi:predicted RNA-binding Zn-ribbon protein involved in translation (DUF1610 family)
MEPQPKIKTEWRCPNCGPVELLKTPSGDFCSICDHPVDAAENLRATLEQHRPALEAVEAAIEQYGEGPSGIGETLETMRAQLEDLDQVRYHIELRPHVLLDPCPKCGKVMETHAEAAVTAAKAGADIPLECPGVITVEPEEPGGELTFRQCGQKLLATKSLIVS